MTLKISEYKILKIGVASMEIKMHLCLNKAKCWDQMTFIRIIVPFLTSYHMVLVSSLISIHNIKHVKKYNKYCYKVNISI